MIRSAQRAVRSVRSRLLGRWFGTVVSVKTDLPWVALTFDDGPHPVTTPKVLEVLSRHDAHATFFMVGQAARRAPDLVRQVAASGHAIGHHTLDHVKLPGLERAEVEAQVTGGFEAVGPACDRLFRPPFGHIDRTSYRVIRRAGHDVITWSGHASDWASQDADALTARLNACLRPGAIVLLHDLPMPVDAPGAPRAALLQSLERVLAAAAAEWRFVTLPELLTAGRPRRRVRWRSDESD